MLQSGIMNVLFRLIGQTSLYRVCRALDRICELKGHGGMLAYYSSQQWHNAVKEAKRDRS